MEIVGLAKVRKTPPQLQLGEIKAVPDSRTLEAIIANRYEVMATYARDVRAACAAELDRLKSEGQTQSQKWREMVLAKRWLHRDDQHIPAEVKADLVHVCEDSPRLQQLIAMREELRQLWTRTNVSAEQLVKDLQDWCKRAEESGIAALQQFAVKLRAAQA